MSEHIEIRHNAGKPNEELLKAPTYVWFAALYDVISDTQRKVVDATVRAYMLRAAAEKVKAAQEAQAELVAKSFVPPPVEKKRPNSRRMNYRRR